MIDTSGPGPAPRLSVIIACRDAERLLPVQLAALARQECPVPWEILVCDNGSTDGTVAVARAWADRLPVRIVDASGTLGAGPARNAGVEAARGEWIAFCDADDEVADGWAVALCAALAEHPVVAGRFEAHRLNSRRVLRSRELDQQTGLQHSSEVVDLPHAGAGNLGLHRWVFREVGGFDPTVRYLQDTDLCWRLQLAGHEITFDPDVVVHVRLRSTVRSMYRQGRNYGASLADLERRHADAARLFHARQPLPTVGRGSAADDGPLTAPDGAPTVSPGAEHRDHDADHRASGRLRLVRGGWRLARYFVAHRSSIGEQAWQVGWHLGYRSGPG